MAPDKKRNLIAATTASMVLLLFILVGEWLFQLVNITSKKAKIEDLKKQIAELTEEQNQLTDDIDLWVSQWKIEERARELKYVFPDDK